MNGLLAVCFNDNVSNPPIMNTIWRHHHDSCTLAHGDIFPSIHYVVRAVMDQQHTEHENFMKYDH